MSFRLQRVLLPASWLYGFLLRARNWMFDQGLAAITDSGVPVISVGNMTVGGTGKTPLVEYLTGTLLARGYRVAVVSRGYRRSTTGPLVVSNGVEVLAGAAEGGDEAVQVARKFPGALVVVGESRSDAARIAVAELGAEVIVLDDGFQHRSLKRTLDIVLLDGRKNIFREPILPAGERREPLSALRRAQVLAFSRADVPGDRTWWERLRREEGPLAVQVRSVFDHAVELPGGERRPIAGLRGKRVLLFSGIGDHLLFVRQAENEGITVVEDIRFPDHHRFRRPDIESVVGRAAEAGAGAVATTEKDYVRLGADPELLAHVTKSYPLYVLALRVDFMAGREAFDQLVLRTCPQRAT